MGMRIKLVAYGRLQEKTGSFVTTITVKEGTKFGDILKLFQIPRDDIMYPLINGKRVSSSTEGKDGDEITLLPSLGGFSFPVKDWVEAISVRTSRRDYQKKSLGEDLFLQLHQKARELTGGGSRILVLEQGGEEIFTGLAGLYGVIRGAKSCGVFLGDEQDPHYLERTGYLGEAFILYVTSLGLGSCWMAGFFHRQRVVELLSLKEKEMILAVTPIGFTSQYSSKEKLMRYLIRGHRRKDLEILCTGLKEAEWAPWMKSALTLARIAPSALNRQPWRFHISPTSITVGLDKKRLDPRTTRRLDCGIAMLHLELGAQREGVVGHWEYLDPPLVARYVVDN